MQQPRESKNKYDTNKPPASEGKTLAPRAQGAVLSRKRHPSPLSRAATVLKHVFFKKAVDKRRDVSHRTPQGHYPGNLGIMTLPHDVRRTMNTHTAQDHLGEQQESGDPCRARGLDQRTVASVVCSLGRRRRRYKKRARKEGDLADDRLQPRAASQTIQNKSGKRAI